MHLTLLGSVVAIDPEDPTVAIGQVAEQLCVGP